MSSALLPLNDHRVIKLYPTKGQDFSVTRFIKLDSCMVLFTFKSCISFFDEVEYYSFGGW